MGYRVGKGRPGTESSTDCEARPHSVWLVLSWYF